MNAGIDLTGRWVGHYAWEETPFPVSFDLVQNGARLKGTMHEGRTYRERPLLEALAEWGKSLSAQRDGLEIIRQLLGGAPLSAIKSYTRLPDMAVLKGKLQGNQVTFRIRYEGVSDLGYSVGERRVACQARGLVVHYEGQVESDADTLRGSFRFTPRLVRDYPPLVIAASGGSFLLRRDSTVSEPLQTSQEDGTAIRPGRPWYAFWHKG